MSLVATCFVAHGSVADLVQLVFASQSAATHRAKLILPRNHSFLEMDRVDLAAVNGVGSETMGRNWQGRFYPGADESDRSAPKWSEFNSTFARYILQTRVLPAVPKPHEGLRSLISRKTLVIHLRNGDVFQVHLTVVKLC